MIETKARARESAARLLANAPCIPRLLGEVSPLIGSIGPSWPVLDARLGVKNVSRSGSARAPSRARLIRGPPTSEGDVHNADCLAALAASSVKSKVSLLKCRHEPRRSRRVPGCLDRQRLIAGVE